MWYMSETYQSKRERWQRLLESLPVGLREHVSLRNVEAVAALTPRAQERLAEAIQSGLKRIPRAVERLRINPDTSIADLLNSPPDFVAKPPQPVSDFPGHIQQRLADLIQRCFPDMPRISAEALANSDVMDAARNIAQAHDQLFRSNHLRTDFVTMVLYGLIRQTLDRLEEVIEATPALRQAFDQSHLPWNSNDRRRINA
jgi:hypothetical protein